MKNRTRQVDDSETLHNIPLGYWETCDAREGGSISTISQKGLCIWSQVNMPVGIELGIRLFFPTGCEFDGFLVLGKIVGKDLCHEESWGAFEYELEFTWISEKGRPKLRNLLMLREPEGICS